MRGEDERAAGARVDAGEQIENVRGRVGVEICSRLIGENELRLGDHRASDGDTLSLTAGELIRSLLQLLAQSDFAEPSADARIASSAWHVLQQQRIFNVLVRIENRNEIERLKDEAEGVEAEGGETVERRACDVDVVDHDAAGVRFVDAADEIEQRGLAAAGRSGDGDEVSARDRQRYFFERANANPSQFVALTHAVERDHIVGSHIDLLRYAM